MRKGLKKKHNPNMANRDWAVLIETNKKTKKKRRSKAKSSRQKLNEEIHEMKKGNWKKAIRQAQKDLAVSVSERGWY